MKLEQVVFFPAVGKPLASVTYLYSLKRWLYSELLWGTGIRRSGAECLDLVQKAVCVGGVGAVF